MAAIKRSAIKPPVLPREAVKVAALGGEVIVRGLLLRERLSLLGTLRDKAEGAVDFAHVCEVLATCVLADDNKPIYTAADWEAFGGMHMGEALELFAKCQALSGLDGEAVKKS